MIHKDVNYVQLAAVCDKLPRFLNRLNLGEGVLHAPAPATGDLGMSSEKPDEDDSSYEDPTNPGMSEEKMPELGEMSESSSSSGEKMPELLHSSSEEKIKEVYIPAAPKDAHAQQPSQMPMKRFSYSMSATDEWEVIDAEKDDSAAKPDCCIVTDDQSLRRALLRVAHALKMPVALQARP